MDNGGVKGIVHIYVHIWISTVELVLVLCCKYSGYFAF